MDEQTTGTVVVGFDGSAGSGPAVDWAAGEADRRGARLAVLSAAGLPDGLPPLRSSPEAAEAVEEAAQQLAEEGADRAWAAHPYLVTVPVTRRGGAARALVEASRSADLVVVGSRGHGEVAAAVIGSVAAEVASHAACPVVVVHAAAAAAPGSPVVVAVDASATAAAAVRFAADRAASLGRPLRVVTTWRIRPSGTWAVTFLQGAYPDPTPQMLLERLGQEAVRAAAEIAWTRHPGLEVSTAVVQGPPGEAVATASPDAELVVVGARGVGGFRGLLMGSVSRAVVQAAQRPVVVVRAVPAAQPEPSAAASLRATAGASAAGRRTSSR